MQHESGHSSTDSAGLPPWYVRRRAELLDLAANQLNLYVYDADTVRAAVRRLQNLQSVDRLLYAMKANFHAGILGLLADLGVDFECVSPGEIRHVLGSVEGLDRERILFTPNFAPRSDYEWALANGIRLTLDNLFPLRHWPELFAGQRLFVRIDPGQGHGHHEHVRTAGEHAKFGVPTFEVDELVGLVEAIGAEVVGIHAHIGSGVAEAESWFEMAEQLATVARRFPQVRVLDIGGGLGVPDRPGRPAFDLGQLDRALLAIRQRYPEYEIWMEPGRYLVAEAGILLTHVTQTKGKGAHRYVGVATGMNALIRPALYGAWHEIVNLTRYAEPATETVTVVGPICETGDRLGIGRRLPPCRENDVIVIANAGAYARAMASEYNLRPVPDELLL